MSDANWKKVKEILDGSLTKWTEENGRDPKLKVTHEGHLGWETPKELAESDPYGKQLIEPDKVGNGRGEETNLVTILRRSIGGFRRMPSRGPYLPEDEIKEIAAWIDAGMPE